MRSLIVALSLVFCSLALAGPPDASPALIEKGKATFTINCVPCHGATGSGDGPAAVALNPKPRDFTKEPLKNGEKPEELFKTVSEGLKGTPMVGFAHLPEEERWGLTYFVLQLRNAGKPPAAAAKPAAGAAKPGAKAGAKK
jgi:mono/diheme cytochrome c family protein